MAIVVGIVTVEVVIAGVVMGLYDLVFVVTFNLKSIKGLVWICTPL